jgi:hypothetical protein
MNFDVNAREEPEIIRCGRFALRWNQPSLVWLLRNVQIKRPLVERAKGSKQSGGVRTQSGYSEPVSHLIFVQHGLASFDFAQVYADILI